MPTLGEVPFLDGPYLELDDPTPAIEQLSSLEALAVVLHTVPFADAIRQMNEVITIETFNDAQNQQLVAGQGALDLAELAVPAGNLTAEITELEQREALNAGIDQALVELAGVDPANIEAPPLTLVLTELAEIRFALADGLSLWDGAFPLWPFFIE